MQASLNILLFSASLRKLSTNTGIINFIQNLAPSFPSVNFDYHPLGDLPLYNGDLDPTESRRPAGSPTEWPVPVKILRDKVEKADLLILSASEHNANVSPVLINAISWASRSEKVVRDGKEVNLQPIIGKKVAIISSGGGKGGENAQNSLKNMNYLKWQFLELPSGPLYVRAFQPGNFSATGDLLDEEIKKNVKALVEHAVNSAKK